MGVTTMAVPSWGLSVVQNYKNFFKERYGRDTSLHDDVIWDIYNTVHDDSSNDAADKARVEEMLDREQY